MRDSHYDPNEGEFVDFETLANWERFNEELRAEIRALQLMLHIARETLEECSEHFGWPEDCLTSPHINMLIGEPND